MKLGINGIRLIRPKRRTGPSAIAQRGHAIYLRLARKELTRVKRGRAVAVDVKTGEFEIGDSALEATDKLLSRQPKAQVWLERVGYPAYNTVAGWPYERSRR